MACYPLQGSLREPQTAAVVTFIRHCLPAGNTHTHTLTKHIHSTAGTHWVMMGLSSPITACSSRLGSRAQSVEMDSSQEVSGPWFLAPQPKCTVLNAAGGSVPVVRYNRLMLFSVFYICVIFSSWYHSRDVSGWAHCIINPFFGHAVVSLMIIMWLRWKNKGIRWINDRFYNVTWFMGRAVINGHLIEPQGKCCEINLYVVRVNL